MSQQSYCKILTKKCASRLKRLIENQIVCNVNTVHAIKVQYRDQMRLESKIVLQALITQLGTENQCTNSACFGLGLSWIRARHFRAQLTRAVLKRIFRDQKAALWFYGTKTKTSLWGSAFVLRELKLLDGHTSLRYFLAPFFSLLFMQFWPPFCNILVNFLSNWLFTDHFVIFWVKIGLLSFGVGVQTDDIFFELTVPHLTLLFCVHTYYMRRAYI